MADITTAWAAPSAGPLIGGAPLYPTRPGPAASAHDAARDIARRRARGALVRRAVTAPLRGALSLARYWSVLGAAAAGWATLAIAYCPWQLMPQTPQELAIPAFGAVAGATGALVMILHPERPHH
jgi:hypothetical protein